MSDPRPPVPAPDNAPGHGYGYGPPQAGGYGYYYGAGGYGAGGYGGGGGEEGGGRSFRDYLLILRERIWYFIVTFFIIFTGTILYTSTSTPIYRSTATIQQLRDEIQVFSGSNLDPSRQILNTEDFNTQVQILSSATIIGKVQDRLKDETLRDFMAPYRDRLSLAGPLTPAEVLGRNRSVNPRRMSLVIDVAYTHPDPQMAAQVANYFVEEYINYSTSQAIETSMSAVEDLRVRVTQQQDKVEELETQLAEYRKRNNNAYNLDQGDRVIREELSSLTQARNEAKERFSEAQQRWTMARDAREAGERLVDLPFIAQDEQISQLLSRLSQNKIEVAQLAKRYKEKHPTMREALNALEETRNELDSAVASAYQKIRVDYELAKSAFERSSERLAMTEGQLLELEELQVGYNSLLRELDAQQQIYEAMLLKLETEIAETQLVRDNARIVDRAAPSPEDDPYKPNWAINLAGGFIGGMVAGLGLVFVVAFFDDRVKSAFDVEAVIGLPLIGVVPRIKRLSSTEKAKAVAANSDKRVTESFRSIHSAMRINELSKNATTLLTTSTVPSEGKSFVSTNIALTFAVHGERVLIIDCDLRMPNIGKSLGLEETKGVIPHIEQGATLEDSIYADVYPNLDVMLAGGKANNPTQLLSTKRFGEMLLELQQRYDRIFIDSPPLAAVSDALSMLNNVDGVVYVIKFNAVKRKTIKANLRRLVDANVPVFGAVLNQISVGLSSYYYTNYYDKAYQHYYSQNGMHSPVPVAPRPQGAPTGQSQTGGGREEEEAGEARTPPHTRA